MSFINNLLIVESNALVQLKVKKKCNLICALHNIMNSYKLPQNHLIVCNYLRVFDIGALSAH